MEARTRSPQYDSEPGLDRVSARSTGRRGKFRLSAFSALRNRDYRWFWFGTLASFNAMQMQMVARGWLVYTMTVARRILDFNRDQLK